MPFVFPPHYILVRLNLQCASRRFHSFCTSLADDIRYSLRDRPLSFLFVHVCAHRVCCHRHSFAPSSRKADKLDDVDSGSARPGGTGRWRGLRTAKFIDKVALTKETTLLLRPAVFRVISTATSLIQTKNALTAAKSTSYVSQSSADRRATQ